jgi:hypothetical protein
LPRCPDLDVAKNSLTLRTAEVPLRSSHVLPERIYSISYAAPSKSLLVSMAHRHVYVYNLPELAASSSLSEQALKPAQQRESALKFLTRSVACMADGKGTSAYPMQVVTQRIIHANNQDGHLVLSRVVLQWSTLTLTRLRRAGNTLSAHIDKRSMASTAYTPSTRSHTTQCAQSLYPPSPLSFS